MARRSDHTKEQLELIIIDAGWNIIKKEGFSNFSARGIAKEIGYSVGTVYNIYGSHDNLILHINARTLDHWYEEIVKTLKNKDNADIYVLAEQYINYSREHYNEWMALFEHNMGRDENVPEWYMEKMNRFFRIIEDMLMPLAKNNKEEATKIAKVIWAGIHGICILSLSKKLELVGAGSPKELARSFIENYLRGIENE